MAILPSLEHPLRLKNNCAQRMRLSTRPSFAVTSNHMHKQALCFPWEMAPLCFYSRSSSQTSVPGVSKGHAGHLSQGHNGYSLVRQKLQDFQLNSFQVKVINLCNIKIFLALLYPTIQAGKQGEVGRKHMCNCSYKNTWLPGAGDGCVGSCLPFLVARV